MGVSLENIEEQGTVLVDETVVSPVDAPSATVPVTQDLVVSTEPVVPVAEVTEQIAEAVAVAEVEAVAEATQNEFTVLQEKADELLEIQSTMEQYSALISKNGLKGISGQTAEAIALHLKGVTRQLGIESKLVSMESFATKDLREQHAIAVVSLEDIRKTAKAAGKRFMDVIERILEIIKRIGYNYLDGLTGLEKAIAKVDQRLGTMRVVDVNDDDIEINGASILVQGGRINITVPDEIKGLAHFTATDYPAAVAKYFDDLTKTVLRFDPSGISEEEVKALFEAAGKPLKAVAKEMDGEIFPGDYMLDVSDHELSFGIKAPQSADEVKSIKPITTQVMRKTARDLKALVDQLKTIRPECDKIDKSGKKLIEAVKRVDERSEKSGNEGADWLVVGVGDLVKKSSPRIGEILQYLVGYIKAELLVINAVINHYEKAEK